MSRTPLVVAAALALLTGCGGSDGEEPRSRTAAPATATPAPTTAAPAAAKVRIDGFQYAPMRIEVERGTRVTWINRDQSNHTVTFAGGQKGVDNIRARGRGAVTFKKRGSFAYICEFHPNMKGTVVVG